MYDENIYCSQVYENHVSLSEEVLFERDVISTEVYDYVKNNWKDFIPYKNISKNYSEKITIREPFSIFNI